MNLLHALMFIIVVAMATGQSIKIRINQQALNLVADSTLSAIEEVFEKMNFSDLDGSYSLSDEPHLFNISNLVLHGLDFTKPIFTLQSPNKLLIKTSRSIGNITGDYYIRYTLTSTGQTSYTGNFRGKMSGGSVVITVKMNEDDGAFRTSASNNDCQLDISNINVHEKNEEDGTNILEDILSNSVKNEIIAQMCSTLIDGLVPKVNSFIGNLETAPIDILGVSIDLNLVGDPVVTEMNNKNNSFVEAVLNGKCYPVSNPNIAYNFNRGILPEFSSLDASVRLMLGNYVLQTLLNAFYETGIFTQQIDLDDPLVTDISTQFNTAFIRNIAPNIDNLNFTREKPVRLMLEATNSPAITMNPTNIIVDGQFVVSVFVINDSRPGVTGADRNATFAFSLSANASMSGHISITKDIIFPTLSSLTYSISVLEAEPVGNNIKIPVLQFVLLFGKQQIIKAVNGLLAGGIKLPAAFGFGLTNLELELYKGYAEMSANVALVSN